MGNAPRNACIHAVSSKLLKLLMIRPEPVRHEQHRANTLAVDPGRRSQRFQLVIRQSAITVWRLRFQPRLMRCRRSSVFRSSPSFAGAVHQVAHDAFHRAVHKASVLHFRHPFADGTIDTPCVGQVNSTITSVATRYPTRELRYLFRERVHQAGQPSSQFVFPRPDHQNVLGFRSPPRFGRRDRRYGVRVPQTPGARLA